MQCSLVAVLSQQSPATPGSVSTGLAGGLRPIAGTGPCTNQNVTVQPDVFPTQTGSVTSSDGKRWTVPGEVKEGPFAVDVFNDCTGPGANPDWEKQLQTVVIDPDGVDITGVV